MKGIGLASILWLCSVVPASAQEPPANVPILGWLSPATTESYHQPGPGNPGLQILRDSLAKHGLIDGKNIRVVMRLAEGKLDRLPALAEALVHDGASVILAYGETAGRAAQAATKTLPIVCIGDDLVNSGLAASLAKPGSNITGGSILATELDAKRIEVLRDLLPNAKRFGVLNDPATSGPERSQAIAEIARRLGLDLQTIDIGGQGDLGLAFEAFRAGGVEGVNIVSSAMLVSFRRRIGELSLGAKIPAICQFRNMVEAGCLASYGITVDDIYAISAEQVAKLLNGAKPADLPVQQPTRFKLVLNLKTAGMLGITVPPTVIARAEEVIE
jgi:putative tryptophan/tyrosine transport system substrate-binding protein